MKTYYDYQPLSYNDLVKKFYRTTSIDKSKLAMKQIFMSPLHNNIHHLTKDGIKDTTLYAMCKPSIALYGYYLNHPIQFGNDPYYIIAWLIKYAMNVFLSIHYIALQNDRKKYYTLSNKFVEFHHEKILRELEVDAKIVARKAYDIESQRKT